MSAYQDIVNSLAIPEEDKAKVLSLFRTMEKNVAVAEFKYSRTNLDKEAITNVLNATIQDLNSQKQIIENAKDEIQKQKNDIEIKNQEITEAMELLKSAQVQLVQSEKMASLGQLTAGIAHEINNPINFVSANVIPLKEDIDDLLSCMNVYEKVIQEHSLESYFAEVRKCQQRIDIQLTIEEIDDLLNGIRIGAERTTEIVKGLRNFSRLDQSDWKKANVNDCIESTLVVLHSSYKDRVSVIKDLGDLPEILCFPGQLNQVFMNIISNGLQAIEGKGSIFISSRISNNYVIVSIKDTGHGMPKEVLEKIFDPFFTTKDVGEGTGLGLSISYGIIQKHRGKIEVTSTINKGTEFTIYIPTNNT